MSESSLNHHTTTHEHQSRLRRGTVLAVASIAQCMVVLDVTIINVALPQIRTALHMSASAQQWVINAYALTFAGFLMLGGRAADVFGIVSTDSYAWTSPRTIATLTGGVALLVSFIVIEARFASNAIVPLRTFRRRTLTLANAQSTVVGAVVFGSYFFLSLYLQDVKHYSPLRAGLAFLPMGLMTFGGALVASRLVKRVGIRRQLVIASLVTAAAVFWLSHLTAHSSYLGSLLVPLLLVGASIGVTFVPMTMAATMGVPRPRAIWPQGCSIPVVRSAAHLALPSLGIASRIVGGRGKGQV
jgi:predicted MFS family arabinose efflux permease